MSCFPERPWRGDFSKKKFCYLAIFLSFSACSPMLQSDLVVLDSIGQLEKKCAPLWSQSGIRPEDVLLVFDIDMTLIQPDHPATSLPVLLRYRDLYHSIISSLPRSIQRWPAAWTTVSLPQRLVEPQIPQWLSQWQKRGFRSMALTAGFAGKFGPYEHLELERAKILKDFGISFDSSWPEQRESSRKMGQSVFPHGILSINAEGRSAGKGEALLVFLQKVSFSPKVIILLDDQRKNLEDVQAALQIHLPTTLFLGLEYRAALRSKFEEISEADFRAFWQEKLEELRAFLPSEESKEQDPQG
jgi:hypothetical protein